MDRLGCSGTGQRAGPARGGVRAGHGGLAAGPVVQPAGLARDHHRRRASCTAGSAGPARSPWSIREAQAGDRRRHARACCCSAPRISSARPCPNGITVVPISCQSEGALEVYIEPVVPAPHLVIVGGSPMAHTLADLARALGWRTKLVAGADFPAADADERSMVIVATQGHGDEEAVEQAVAASPAYLGLVGSRRRGAAVLGYLADRGLPGDQLDRVHVPAGLDLGHTTHQEIAVAILAELVQLRASGALAGAAGAAPARHARRPIAAPGSTAAATSGRTQAASSPGEATDPVCGMTVPAPAASHPLAHDGVTYYFCCAGCRRKFEQDPAAYATEGNPMLIKNDFEVAAPGRQGLAVLRRHPAGGRLPARHRADRRPRRRQIRGPGGRPDGTGPAPVRRRRPTSPSGRGGQAPRGERDRRRGEGPGPGQHGGHRDAGPGRAGAPRSASRQDLQLSGAAAQYGRGMISDVSAVLMRDFSVNLADRIDRGRARREALTGQAPRPARRAASPSACGPR